MRAIGMDKRISILVAGLVLALSVPGAAMAVPDTTPPTVPGDLRITAATAASVTLAWNASWDSSGTWYYLLEDNFGNISYPQKTQTSALRTGLLPGRTYTYRIRAFDASQNYSGWSGTVSHVTPPDTTPPASPVLTVPYLAPVMMTVQWTSSTDNSPGMIYYQLLVNGAPWTGGTNGKTLLNLTPSTSYTLVVRVRDSYGNEGFSNTVIVTAPAVSDFVAPSAPANLTGRSDAGGCEVYLRWDQAADNIDPQNRLLYRFYVDGVLSPPQSFVIGRGTNIGVSVLEGTQGTNVFQVQAVDGSGNLSALSNPLSLVIHGC
jgi:chitodextrinase